jgi:inosine-uridine nucleoside N-ribohydrolase
MTRLVSISTLVFLLVTATLIAAQPRRKIIIDEDCSGAGGSNMQTVALLLQSHQAEVLGITVVSGNQWRDEELAHTLRLLEIMGRTDIPVFAGAAFPLVRTREEAQLWQQRFGKVAFAGAWDNRWWHEAAVVPPLPEGAPTLKPQTEDAAHFLVRMVRKYPHQVTIYAGGPMTDVAQALSLDPQFAELAEHLVFMGGSLNPQTADPEFANNPRHEFNFWFDPEAARTVLAARWKKITCTPVDISIRTRLTPAMIKRIASAGTPLARYVARFYQTGQAGEYMWDELAAASWIDPSLITKTETRYVSVDTSHGAEYGNTLTWSDEDQPRPVVRPVVIQLNLDNDKFDRIFVDLLSASHPR